MIEYIMNLVIQTNNTKEDKKMKIKKVTWRNGADFHAIYKCEHCGDEHTDYGYSDQHFYEVVIPKLVCKKCKKSSEKTQ